ncbi:MAG: lasso peptide biosynthesis PqqD family chaperone [Oscillospiraceae bacterium]|nr:lasso peptide biosynthesis PqqD family chaperone [Oscillospiraceae bacterium]
MTDTTVLSRRAGLMTADMNGSAVMMDIMTGKYYNLGAVGGRIWELLEEPMTIASLVQKLTAEYDVSAETCRTDILPFLDTLLERGLLLAD